MEPEQRVERARRAQWIPAAVGMVGAFALAAGWVEQAVAWAVLSWS